MDYRCRLGSLGNSCTSSECSDLEGTVGLSYSLGRLDFFLPHLTSFHTPHSLPFFFFFVLFHSWCSHVRVFGKTRVHEFHISYSHTERYLLFSNAVTASAQCVFGEKSENT